METKEPKQFDFIESTLQLLQKKMDRFKEISSDENSGYENGQFDAWYICYNLFLNALAAEKRLQVLQNFGVPL